MDGKYKAFFSQVSKFTDETFDIYSADLKNIVRFMFGEGACHNDVLLRHLFQFLSISRKFILERPNQCHVKSVVRMANIVLSRKLSAVEDDRIYFEVFFIILLYYENQKMVNSLNYDCTATMLEHYPSFSDIPEPELSKLLTFRNWMKITILVIPSYHNKGRLLNVVTRITEGDTCKYVTGSGQHLATERRVYIYEQEGNTVKKNRPKRKNKEKDAYGNYMMENNNGGGVYYSNFATNLTGQPPVYADLRTLTRQSEIAFGMRSAAGFTEEDIVLMNNLKILKSKKKPRLFDNYSSHPNHFMNILSQDNNNNNNISSIVRDGNATDIMNHKSLQNQLYSGGIVSKNYLNNVSDYVVYNQGYDQNGSGVDGKEDDDDEEDEYGNEDDDDEVDPNFLYQLHQQRLLLNKSRRYPPPHAHSYHHPLYNNNNNSNNVTSTHPFLTSTTTATTTAAMSNDINSAIANLKSSSASSSATAFRPREQFLSFPRGQLYPNYPPKGSRSNSYNNNNASSSMSNNRIHLRQDLQQQEYENELLYQKQLLFASRAGQKISASLLPSSSAAAAGGYYPNYPLNGPRQHISGGVVGVTNGVTGSGLVFPQPFSSSSSSSSSSSTTSPSSQQYFMTTSVMNPNIPPFRFDNNDGSKQHQLQQQVRSQPQLSSSSSLFSSSLNYLNSKSNSSNIYNDPNNYEHNDEEQEDEDIAEDDIGNDIVENDDGDVNLSSSHEPADDATATYLSDLNTSNTTTVNDIVSTCTDVKDHNDVELMKTRDVILIENNNHVDLDTIHPSLIINENPTLQRSVSTTGVISRPGFDTILNAQDITRANTTGSFGLKAKAMPAQLISSSSSLSSFHQLITTRCPSSILMPPSVVPTPPSVVPFSIHTSMSSNSNNNSINKGDSVNITIPTSNDQMITAPSTNHMNKSFSTSTPSTALPFHHNLPSSNNERDKYNFNNEYINHGSNMNIPHHSTNSQMYNNSNNNYSSNVNRSHLAHNKNNSRPNAYTAAYNTSISSATTAPDETAYGKYKSGKSSMNALYSNHKFVSRIGSHFDKKNNSGVHENYYVSDGGHLNVNINSHHTIAPVGGWIRPSSRITGASVPATLIATSQVKTEKPTAAYASANINISNVQNATATMNKAALQTSGTLKPTTTTKAYQNLKQQLKQQQKQIWKDSLATVAAQYNYRQQMQMLMNDNNANNSAFNISHHPSSSQESYSTTTSNNNGMNNNNADVSRIIQGISVAPPPTSAFSSSSSAAWMMLADLDTPWVGDDYSNNNVSSAQQQSSNESIVESATEREQQLQQEKETGVIKRVMMPVGDSKQEKSTVKSSRCSGESGQQEGNNSNNDDIDNNNNNNECDSERQHQQTNPPVAMQGLVPLVKNASNLQSLDRTVSDSTNSSTTTSETIVAATAIEAATVITATRQQHDREDSVNVLSSIATAPSRVATDSYYYPQQYNNNNNNGYATSQPAITIGSSSSSATAKAITGTTTTNVAATTKRGRGRPRKVQQQQ